jgi:ABC-type Zn uptake system ZnuABC Zn-binding protein ZnuA
VSTISPITSIVHNIGGDRIELSGIVPEGTDSHTFEPAPSDARLLSQADVVFLNGLHLEESTRSLVEDVGADAVVVSLGERAIDPDDELFDFSFPIEAGDPNPHLWTDPVLGKRYAEVVSDTLSEIDPAGASTYRRNYDTLARRIDALVDALKAMSSSLPAERRKLLTYHDSFPYFARDFDWEIVGAVQPSDFSDPTPREVADLITQIRAESVPAVFGSEEFPSPVLQQVADETGASYVDDLRDDDLPGEPGDEDHSYLGLLRSDYVTIGAALGADVTQLRGLDVENPIGDGEVNYR